MRLIAGKTYTCELAYVICSAQRLRVLERTAPVTLPGHHQHLAPPSRLRRSASISQRKPSRGPALVGSITLRFRYYRN